jgi:hypothetical protein
MTKKTPTTEVRWRCSYISFNKGGSPKSKNGKQLAPKRSKNKIPAGQKGKMKRKPPGEATF